MRGTFANIRLRNQLVEGNGGPVHRPPPGRRAGLHLRRRDALRGRGRPAGDPRRSRIRLGLVARLGGQGTGAPRRPVRRWPRASSGSTAPTWSGWASCRSSSSRATAPSSLGLTGREMLFGTGWPAARRHARPWRSPRPRPGRGGDGAPVRCDRPPRRPDRRRVLPRRRDPAGGPAQARHRDLRPGLPSNEEAPGGGTGGFCAEERALLSIVTRGPLCA